MKRGARISLLDNFPHECTIRKRTRAKGSLIGSKDSFPATQTAVSCWEQNATHGEILDYEKRGISITRKVYFLTDPGVNARNTIEITKRRGVDVSSPIRLDVRSKALPDASAGLGVVFKVMVEEVTSEKN